MLLFNTSPCKLLQQFVFAKSNLEENMMSPLRLPKVEQATTIGMTTDAVPSTLSPTVSKQKHIKVQHKT